MCYIGETSNSYNERASQHLRDYQDESKDSHLRNHLEDTHNSEGDPKSDFKFSILSTHPTALTRQVREAWMIKSFEGGILLNSKYEYNHGILPSLTTTDPRTQLAPEALKRPNIVREAEK